MGILLRIINILNIFINYYPEFKNKEIKVLVSNNNLNDFIKHAIFITFYFIFIDLFEILVTYFYRFI